MDFPEKMDFSRKSACYRTDVNVSMQLNIFQKFLNVFRQYEVFSGKTLYNLCSFECFQLVRQVCFRKIHYYFGNL